VIRLVGAVLMEQKRRMDRDPPLHGNRSPRQSQSRADNDNRDGGDHDPSDHRI